MTRLALSAALLAFSCLLGACADDSGTGAPVDATNEKSAQGDPGDQTPTVDPGSSCAAGASRDCLLHGDVTGKQTCVTGQDGLAAWGECVSATCDAADVGDVGDCQAADGSHGARQCQSDQTWTECGRLSGMCKPGDTMECQGGMGGSSGGGYGSAVCALEDGEWRYPVWACSTPLVISFDGKPVAFSQASGSFDVQGAGVCAATDWVTAATPWLALDRDGNGRIDDGAELFGSMTRLPGGERARQGFEALAPLDSDGDGQITPADGAWSQLVLWRDANQDRVSQPGELRGLDAEGIVAIDLGYRLVPRCEVGGSCEGERAGVRWRDAGGQVRRGAVVDVRLADR